MMTEKRRHYISRTDAFAGARVVDRDPCKKCGVRGDIGCEHQPASPVKTLADAIK